MGLGNWECCEQPSIWSRQRERSDPEGVLLLLFVKRYFLHSFPSLTNSSSTKQKLCWWFGDISIDKTLCQLRSFSWLAPKKALFGVHKIIYLGIIIYIS